MSDLEEKQISAMQAFIEAEAEIVRLTQQVARDDEHYAAAMAMNEKHRKLWVEASQQRDALRAENERLRVAHQDIVRKYERVTEGAPAWTSFTEDQLKWVREAWYGAALISRNALNTEQKR
jgi:hypothetical protein